MLTANKKRKGKTGAKDSCKPIAVKENKVKIVTKEFKVKYNTK